MAEEKSKDAILAWLDEHGYNIEQNELHKWELIDKTSNEILDKEVKLAYLQNQLDNYYLTLDRHTFNVSGMTTHELGPQLLFMDRKIVTKMNIIKRQSESDISVLFQDGAFTLLKEMLEELEITIGGKFSLGKRGGKLFGAIAAIGKFPMLRYDTISEENLLYYFNKYLGTDFKSEINKRTEGYKIGFDDASRFLKAHYKK